MNTLQLLQRTLGTAIIASALATPAHAALLIDQPGSSLPGFTSANGTNGTVRAVFDDFTIGSDFTLTRVEWTGGNVSTFSGVDATTASPVQFYLSIRPDDGTGKPGSVPVVELANFVTIAGSVLSSSAEEVVYRYGLDLAAMPTLNANTHYWLQITAMFSNAVQGLNWDWSAGSGGNGIGSYYDTTLSSYVNASGDRSFTLFGDGPRADVPEPHSAALLLLALGAAGITSRRRKQA
jgi:hypothetical protein